MSSARSFGSFSVRVTPRNTAIEWIVRVSYLRLIGDVDSRHPLEPGRRQHLDRPAQVALRRRVREQQLGIEQPVAQRTIARSMGPLDPGSGVRCTQSAAGPTKYSNPFWA